MLLAPAFCCLPAALGSTLPRLPAVRRGCGAVGWDCEAALLDAVSWDCEAALCGTVSWHCRALLCSAVN